MYVVLHHHHHDANHLNFHQQLPPPNPLWNKTHKKKKQNHVSLAYFAYLTLPPSKHPTPLETLFLD